MSQYTRISPPCEFSDEDLERYLMGRVRNKRDLTQVENHMIDCGACAHRADAIADYIHTMKEALRQVDGECSRDPGR